MRVYLDACCLSRLTDDQSQTRIREEAAAIEYILAEVRRGRIELLSSEALHDEVRRNPTVDQRLGAQTILLMAVAEIGIDAPITLRAKELISLGYGTFDALHVAAAESASVDVLFTTDDKLLKRTERQLGDPRIAVKNPLSWIKEQAV